MTPGHFRALVARWRRANVKSYASAWDALRGARAAKEAGYTIGLRAELEAVREIRRLIAERRRAIAAGRPV